MLFARASGIAPITHAALQEVTARRFCLLQLLLRVGPILLHVQVQMVQWVIAARPGHPVVCRMGRYVTQHVAKERAGLIRHHVRNHAILERTGPGIWSDSVHDYLRQVRIFRATSMGGASAPCALSAPWQAGLMPC